MVVTGERDDEYSLEDMIEYDKTYVIKATSSNKKKSKSGKGTQNNLL
jgi:hypothetical protein